MATAHSNSNSQNLTADIIPAELVPSNLVPAEIVPANLVPAELVSSSAREPGLAESHAGREPLPAPRRFGLLGRSWIIISSLVEWCFGLASLVVGLAMIGSIPLINFLSLGYLLEVSGRVAKSGRIRDGFLGIRAAARFGGVALGTWLVLGPLRLISDAWHSAQLIDPHSRQTGFLGFLLAGLTLLGLAHIAWACFRGGKLRHFLWPAPLKFMRRVVRGGMYVEARDRFLNTLAGLHLWYFFRLGVQGFFGAVAWLIVPVLILVGAAQINHPVGILPGLVGFMLLALVLLYLPFLQTHFAVEGRFRAMFELGRVRLFFRYAPLAYWFALFASLLFTLPLFLTQVAEIPAELRWLPNLICVASILPARLFAGWTLGRARQAMFPRYVLLRWLAWVGVLPVSVVYVFVIYFTQYVCYTGWKNLIGQNTLLLPVPFLGL